MLNRKLQSLSSDYERRKSITNKFKSGESNELLDRVIELETKIELLNKDVDRKEDSMAQINQELIDSRMKLEKSRCDYANQQEKMILYETAEKNKTGLQSAENVLNELQTIWSQLGVSDGERRERAKRKLDTCLEDTCNVLLEEAKDLQRRKNEEINVKRKEVLRMLESLGCDDEEKSKIQMLNQESSLTSHMELLKDTHRKLYPKYYAAIQKREKIAKEVKAILKTMEPIPFDLTDNLKLILSSQGEGTNHKKKKHTALLPQMREVNKILAMLGEANDDINEEHSLVGSNEDGGVVNLDELEPGILSPSFLDECEKDLKSLRQRKAEMMSLNNETLAKVQSVVGQMHLTGRASTYLVNKALERKPKWWDHAVCKEICHAVSTEKPSNVIEVNGNYTRHLNLVHDALNKLASQRSIIAEKLKCLLDNAYMVSFIINVKKYSMKYQQICFNCRRL